jgi:SAM-dependent methyltransferase
MKLSTSIVCPCGLQNPLVETKDGYLCLDKQCLHCLDKNQFKNYQGIPLLISFDKCDTICAESDYADIQPKVKIKDLKVGVFSVFKKKILDYIFNDNKVTIENCKIFIKTLIVKRKNPRILVIGGGTLGDGTDQLWSHGDLSITSIDIYPSSTTDYIADAHYLPFQDGSFDGVWIQAVLEHVASPERVVQEIHRVLAHKGIVYAETPFMQQVHMGAYDFQRYTMLGHRYLFKKFNQFDIGPTQGPGVALAWSIRYFLWALFRSEKIAIYLSIPFLIIFRFLDKFIDKRAFWDSSSGVYFMGVKEKELVVMQNELPSKYLGMQ